MRVSCWLFVALGLTASPARAAVVELPGAAALAIYGSREGDLVGHALARGDFDGDGVEDLALGVPSDSPFPQSRMRNGAVYLLFGGSDFAQRLAGGLSAIPNRIVGTRAGQMLGMNIAAGDFDGDGRDDLIMGSPWTTGGDSTVHEGGAAYILLGRERGAFPPVIEIPESADIILLAPAADIHVGEAVAFGDWNGDGLADAAIGAMYANGPGGIRPHAGATYLYYGRPRRKIKDRVTLDRAADLTIHGAERDDTSGRCLVFTDWNGDGRDDLLIAAYYGDGPDNTRTDPGEAYILLGGTKKGVKKKSVDLATPGVTIPIYSGWTRGAFGRAAAAGDVDGDGLGDFLVGAYRAPGEADDRRALAGAVDVVFGRREPTASIDLAERMEYRVLGANYFDTLGRYLAARDLDGDGRAEMLIGVPFGDAEEPAGALRLQCGVVGIVTGRARAVGPDSLDLLAATFDHEIRGAEPGDEIPGALEILDIDADGKMDIVIGAPVAAGRENVSPHTGEVYFLLGASRTW